MEQRGVPALQNRRAQRARRAKETLARSIPDILTASPRARHGIHTAELIVDPDTSSHRGRNPLRIRLSTADTLTAARPCRLRTRNDEPNVAILSMASPWRPGGGFLDGANSQEEFICHRTTAYPSLRDSFYPLPDVGGIYTPDVMVFRDTTPDANDLHTRDRYFVDVITAAAFQFPDVRRGRSDEGLAGICSCGMSYCDRDRELVTRKMKAVMRIAQGKGAKKVVLGAWGCAALGNPVKDVAKLWRQVVAGSPRQRRPNPEQWHGIEEVIFAVPDPLMMREFHAQFHDILAPDLPSPPPDDAHPDDPTWSSTAAKEADLAHLISRVQDTEMQIEQLSNPRAKARLRDVLASLNRELAQGRRAKTSNDDIPSSDHSTPSAEGPGPDDFVFTHLPASDDDDEIHGVYAFDSDSNSSDPPFSPAFEFKPHPPDLVQIETSHDEEDEEEEEEDLDTGTSRLPRFNAKTGWFSGSIDEFHGFLRNGGQEASRRVSREASPVLSAERGAPMENLDEVGLERYLGGLTGGFVVEG
ncbi:hypothetical protein EJ03DRAFT_328887 [Teratosphaeria nubilosa]|uniref:Microbial-type PARG catalytic domain-containing protein n=1 Tax=Teratosphaeria nubilosa TaxID=161662 RepID=A0A6G1L4D3_9PEZI|nr:hypothetical protein EJ03DRAFT_328887 [Teratosphaeria nubilosa]